jgi:hypothetical protein
MLAQNNWYKRINNAETIPSILLQQPTVDDYVEG